MFIKLGVLQTDVTEEINISVPDVLLEVRFTYRGIFFQINTNSVFKDKALLMKCASADPPLDPTPCAFPALPFHGRHY
jgi:hypothetical protein